MARQRSCRCLHLQGHCRNSAHQLTEISLSAKPHNRTSYRRIGIDVRFAAFYRNRHDGRKGEAKRSHTITKMFLQGKFLYFREFFDLEAQEIVVDDLPYLILDGMIGLGRASCRERVCQYV